jgi:DNA polymerase-3 subunit beta
MKVSIHQANLVRGLSIVGRAVARSSSLMVLSNVMLATDDGRLKLSATNLELGINCWVDAKVEAEGATTMPARLLADFVNSLPPEWIDLELAARTQTLNVRCARFEANIKGIDAGEFPVIPTAEDAEHTIRIEPRDLCRMLDQVVFAAATDESRPVLTGVQARCEGDRLTMAAADGFRLSVRSAPLGQAIEETVEVVIPARALGELTRILTDQEDQVEVLITPARNQILFHLGDVDLVTQLVEGKFPDYRQIIPVRTEVAPNGRAAGHLRVTATSAELGDNVGQLDAVVEGDPIEVAFNARYLADVLSVVGTDRVALETSSASSPGVLRPVGDDDFVHVIMPMC